MFAVPGMPRQCYAYGMPTVLIIDDNAAVAIALEVLLSLRDIDALRAASPEAGLELLERHSVDLVLQDMNFSADTTSGEEGTALFRAIRERHPELPVILLTAWTHLDAAVDLVKAGAADYLAKPWDDNRLIATVHNLIELGQAKRALQQRLQTELRQRRELDFIDFRRGLGRQRQGQQYRERHASLPPSVWNGGTRWRGETSAREQTSPASTGSGA